MNACRSQLVRGLVTGLLMAALAGPALAGDEKNTLVRAVPNDVFLCVAGQHNPEREFLDRYWGEVWDALKQSGVGEDLLELIGTFLDAEQNAEVQRLRERVSRLLEGVDWERLIGGEVVFAERLSFQVSHNVSMGVPDMVWLARGDREGAAHNFEGLAAILGAMVEEINNAAGADLLAVARTERTGAKIASVNLLAMVPGAPMMLLTVAQRDDVVFITLGDEMLSDVLGLLSGSASKGTLADEARFKAAFAALPPLEDSMVFFDMQTMLKPLRGLMKVATSEIKSPPDVYVNTRQNPEANRLIGQAMIAYQRGDIRQALTGIQQAYEVAPDDSIVLYNLACFHALLGEREEALGWLEKAVAGGFYAPRKIAGDSDLDSLRQQPRYEAALAKASEMATRHGVADVVLNSSRRGAAYELSMRAWEVYKEQDYEQGLELVEKAHEVAPDDSRVLYYLACFHALLGHKDQALGFLEQSVEGGFYSPRHIAKDHDLESIRDDERYAAALDAAREKAAKVREEKQAGEAALVQSVSGRIMDAVGILDYIAAVESTDGYSTWTESVAVLVPNAASRPFYPVLAGRDQLTDFDRYLPQETVSFSVSGGIDLGELYRFLEDTARLAGPKGAELLEKWAGLQAEFGFDVQQDVLSWLAGDCVTVTLANGQGSVWLIKVSDEAVAREKIAAGFEFLATRLGEFAAENPMLAMLTVHSSPTYDDRLEGFENLHVAMSPQPIVWGVADQHLIFGTSADAVALCLETAKGEHPNIRSNARVMAEAIVPTGPFAGVTLTDQRGLGEEMATGLGIVSMMGGMVGAFIPDPEIRPVITKIAGILAKLTPVVRKIDFYKSTATHTTFDGQRWYTREVTHYVSPAERAAGGTR